MKVLALSGSRRAASINTALLRCAVRLAAPGWHIELFASLGELPLFNPDLDQPGLLPALVHRLRQEVVMADALIIASPEYAHGVSGTMKNALDWLVSYEGFVGKAVAVFNTSPRAHHAHAALLDTLATMSANVILDATLAIPLLGSGLTEDGMLHDPKVADAVRGALQRLHHAVGRPAADSANFPVS
jgi:chromate reductase, NAD(P)H dehydrogenase (quinone)